MACILADAPLSAANQWLAATLTNALSA